jgi:hypothetical protein
VFFHALSSVQFRLGGEMNARRLIPAALAISGAIYAPIAWLNLLLVPGYYVWWRWIGLAVGRWGRFSRGFWLGSAAWNLFVLALMLESPLRGTYPPASWTPLFWHLVIHLASAVVLSAYCAWLAGGWRQPGRSPATA